MELWFMECVAFGCVAVGVCAILYIAVRAFYFVANYQENELIQEMRKDIKAKDEQIDGLRSTVDNLKNELRQSHDSYYSLLIENKRLNHENCAIERENKNL